MSKIANFNKEISDKALLLYSSIISNIANENYRMPDGIYRIYASIFDHWLSEEEAEQLIKPFHVYVNDINENNYNVQEIIDISQSYYKNEFKVTTWYIIIYKNYKILHYNKNKNIFTTYKSLKEFIYAVQKSIREEDLLDVYIPELECAIIGNYDFTLPIYYGDIDKISSILGLANTCGLYILK
jgi:hypothetical protein